MTLKQPGAGGKAEEWGYDFSLLVGWLADILSTESDNVEEQTDESLQKRLYSERYDMLERAISTLQEIEAEAEQE